MSTNIERTNPRGSTGQTRKAALGRAHRLENFTEAVMTGPSLILVIAFVLIPIVVAIYLSFTDWDGFTIPPNWIGFGNYSRLFKDQSVLSAAALTLVITVIGTLLSNIVGLGFALLVNGQSKFNAFMRVIVFYPYVVGPIIIGFLWASILGTNGALNSLFAPSGEGGLPFLSDPAWAIASLIGVLLWSSFGVNVVLYLAGLQTVPESLLEAAKLDGASAWQTFWQVKLPLLAATVTVNIVLSVIGLLRVYEVILPLTDGGPAGTTQSVVFHILSTSFNNSELGYGAAQSVILMIFIVAITLGITSARRKSEAAVAA